ncbi:alpha/beta hydrolase-fold protein [Microbacterium sp. W1N]|uniref:alpha/beta hydrolase n=1 Tax=Microbacterium festucae TaxID=2977531 RepID=UPI0021BF76BA|nr:alpha/beta hydrolase-fold protein [Microbacterium festucae]MCT9820909.1 alpha/beta hydrolase-fold protein [Microbacterium festucae]
MNIWQLQVIDGPFPWAVYALAAVLVVILVVRRWRRRALRWALVGAVIGGLIATAVWVYANVSLVFGDPLPLAALAWAGAALAASGFALGGLVGARVWRRIVSILAVPVFLFTAMLGINDWYDLNPTLGSIFGISGLNELDLPDGASTAAAPAPDAQIYQTWQAPAGMPAKGTRGTQKIPATASGFDARDAGIYLPPAALGADAPALPLVIMMMGQPGNPDPTAIGDVLDEFAAQHDGLAPIVIVADQLGQDGADPAGNDPACADSQGFGNARTYITTDVVAWAKQNLHIIDDPRYWVIAGYSNGGGCAITYGAAFPEKWKNILDVSGEEFPGSERVDQTLATVYGGDQSAFEASKPVTIMQKAPAGAYRGMTAVFTAGSDDPGFSAASVKLADQAKAVGMTVTQYEVPGAGHTGPALAGGLEEGFSVLYPVLGLSAG